MALFDRFLKKSTEKPIAMRVGAFGKHPGWRDFMASAGGVDSGLGVDSSALIDVKRFLQNDGVLRFREREAWNALERESWLGVFRHIFIWRTAAELVAGRVWSSFDSMDRRLPMFLAADASGRPLKWVLTHVLPYLEGLEGRCRAVDSAQEVERLLSTARNDLDAMAAVARTDVRPNRGPEDFASTLIELASRPEWGVDRTGFYRILYQVRRDMADYRSASDDSLELEELQPQQIRVPALSGTAAEDALTWMRFLLSEVHASAPLLVLIPFDGSFADIIAGHPTPAQLRCMISDVAMPSTVPYKLEAEFVEEARKLVESWRAAARRGGAASGVDRVQGARS